MTKKLTDTQISYLLAPKIGSYHASSDDGLSERILRVLDKFVSPSSENIIVKVKMITWVNALAGKQPPFVSDGAYIEAQMFWSNFSPVADYQPADEKQIQRFEEYEVEELRNKKNWK